MRGRHPSGPEYVQRLDGSERAKKRLQAVLETLNGSCRVSEACERLAVGEVRFHQLRLEALQGALAGLEAGSVGRPRQEERPTVEQLQALQEKVQALEIELRVAQTRAEVALAMPHLMQQRLSEKKTRRERKRQRKKAR
jgi:hypothetical protein